MVRMRLEVDKVGIPSLMSQVSVSASTSSEGHDMSAYRVPDRNNQHGSYDGLFPIGGQHRGT